MINNNYLFASQFLDYLGKQKIQDMERFEGFSQTIKIFLKEDISDNISELETSFITGLVSQLQFASAPFEYYSTNQNSKYAYLYDSFPLENKVSCIYLISPLEDVNARTKGNFPAFDLIYLLKKENLEWGILTNGNIWRLYSTLTSLPYENYLEIDFSDASEDEYKVFWQLFTLNLFIPDEYDVTPLEKYIEESEKEAELIEKHIKNSIDEILENISFGFLSYAGKDKQPLSEEEKKEYFNNSVHLLFRLLFVFYAESRLLLPMNNPNYRPYSLEMMLTKAKDWKETGIPDPEGVDLWTMFRDLCIAIDQGDSTLEIPEYDGGLFDPSEHSFLSHGDNQLTNKYFVQILYRLGYFQRKKNLEIKIDYRDLSVRSFGSLYEGILDYKLFIADEDLVIRKIDKKAKIIRKPDAGNLKKTDRLIEKGFVYFSQDAQDRHDTGSYYTPEDVVNYMVQNSVRLGLEERWIDYLPQVQRFEKELKQAVNGDIRSGILKKFDHELLRFVENNILTFKVMDPAMGSGHFLVNSLNTITHFIIEILQNKVSICEGPIKHDISPLTIQWELFNHANTDIDLNLLDWRRRVVEKCIFGIDINPLATELAKLSLWIASAAEGKPLTFLNHHLRSGDSVMGARLKDLMNYPGKDVDNNKDMFQRIHEEEIMRIKEKFRQLLSTDSNDLNNVFSKKEAWEEIEHDLILNHLKDVATLWLMLNFNKKSHWMYIRKIEIPDEEKYFELLDIAQSTEEESSWEYTIGKELYKAIKSYEIQKNVFHWELEFPEIINNYFEAVIGNPPYVDQPESVYCGVMLNSIKSRNLYGYIPERGYQHLKDNEYLSYITPMNVISSKRMVYLQEVFTPNTWYLKNIDSTSHPGMLFKEIQQSINIYSLKKDLENRIYTTNYLRFYHYERKNIFQHEKYYLLNDNSLIQKYTVPKISNKLEEEILECLFRVGKPLSDFITEDNSNQNYVYYRSAGNPYYRLAFDEPPLMEVNGEPSVSTTLARVNILPNYSKHVLITTFYSSLYYWFWTVYSDCYHFHPKDIHRFPLDIDYLSNYKTDFEKLYNEIINDLRKHSEIVIYNKANGSTKYELFKARYSKTVFDKIDFYLGEKLGFSEEMVNFLINYDIKYRTDELCD